MPLNLLQGFAPDGSQQGGYVATARLAVRSNGQDDLTAQQLADATQWAEDHKQKADWFDKLVPAGVAIATGFAAAPLFGVGGTAAAADAAVADVAAVNAAPAAAAAGGGAAATAGAGWTLPTLGQVGQALSLAGTLKGLAGSPGSAPRPGLSNGGSVGYVPAGTGVADNGTRPPGGYSLTPGYFSTPGAGGSLFPSSGGALSPAALFIGAAVLVAALALGHA